MAGAALTASYRFAATAAFPAIFTHANTADRTLTLQNRTGTIALTPTIEVLTSGTSWSVPTGVTFVTVEIFGASGGGGGGSAATTNDGAAGTAGGTTSFNSGALSTTGGGAGYGGSIGSAGSVGAAHGVGSGGTVNRTGGGQSGGNSGEGAAASMEDAAGTAATLEQCSPLLRCINNVCKEQQGHLSRRCRWLKVAE